MVRRGFPSAAGKGCGGEGSGIDNSCEAKVAAGGLHVLDLPVAVQSGELGRGQMHLPCWLKSMLPN